MQVSARNVMRSLAVGTCVIGWVASAQIRVPSLITELRSPDPVVRDRAAQMLGKAHSRSAVKPLIEALDDSNVHVAEHAAEALGELRAGEAIQPLIDSLHHSYCSGIVESNHKAAAALAAIGMPAVPAIMQALSHSSYGISGDASFELKSALDTIHSPEIVPPLAALLQSPNYEARIYAEERLAAHPGRATVDAILPTLNDPNVYVRDSAIRTLGTNMDDPRVLPALRDVIEHPANNAKDHNGPQISALHVLGKQHDPALISVLIDGLQYSDIGLDEASTALIALGPVIIDPVIAALADTSRPEEARYWAAITLDHFSDDPRVLPALLAASHVGKRRVREGAFATHTAASDLGFTNRLLIALVEDKYWRVRQLTGYDLAGHDDPRVTPALITALKDPDENVRAAAADSLAKRHDGSAIQALLDYLHGPTTLDHQQAAEALGKLGDPRAITPLILLLGKPNSGDCYPISAALKQLLQQHPDPDALTLLRKTLGGDSSSRCWPALQLLADQPGSANFFLKRLGEDHSRDSSGNAAPYEALAQSHDPAVLDGLLAALKSPSLAVRRHVTKALSDIGQQGVHLDPRAVEPLLAVLHDPDEEVRSQAAIALINVNDPRKIGPFSSMLRSPDFAMREYAAGVLGQVHDPRAVAALIAVLDDPDFNTHRGLMNALQHNTYPPILPALLAALRSPNSVVRAGAVEALRYRTEPAVRRALVPMQRDSDPKVREAARNALSGCPPPPLMD